MQLLGADKLNAPPLSAEQRNELDYLKNLIVHGIPLNSKHPGVVNLSPNQRRHLITLENKQDRRLKLNPAEEESLDQYKELIAHG